MTPETAVYLLMNELETNFSTLEKMKGTLIY